MKKYIPLIAGLIFAVGANIYFRSFPINFPQLKTQAQNTIEERIRQNAAEQVDKKFPGFDVLAKQTLIDTLLADYKRVKATEIKNDIQKEYLKLKSKYQDDNGQTYLMELDCWHWGRYVDNVVRYGRVGDEVINGIQRDNFMLAPLGLDLGRSSFLFYLSAFLYKIFYIFKPIPLFNFLFYLPLFFAAIFIITLYLFCYYRWGSLAAVISCLFVGLAPIFLPRSCAGWFDMDALNLLFPLLIIWAYIKAYSASSFKGRILWICFSSFWVGLFCFTWLGWFFIFLIIILYEAYSLLNLISIYFQYKEKILILFKQHLVSLASFVFFSVVWIILFAGLAPIVALYNQVTTVFALNSPLSASLWPNVHYTVEELRKPDFLLVTNLTGGSTLFICALVSMLVIFLYALRKRKSTIEYQLIIILIFWFMSMFFACFKGKRFAMFLLIPLGISLGWCLSYVYEYFKDKKDKKLRKFVFSSIIIVAAILAVQFFDNAYRSARNTFPLIDDLWFRTLVKIREGTPRESIINSWWDFGDWFKVVSNRRVIFDGQSQNLPQAYWMGRALITDNEKEAITILRMLNNGGNQAFEIINSYFQDPLKTVLFLDKIILSKTNEQAKEYLRNSLPEQLTKALEKLFFDKPGKAYFIVDPSMPAKMQAISYIGNWNFSKFYLTQNINKKGKKDIEDYLLKCGLNSQEIERLYQEVGLVAKADLGAWVTGSVEFFGGLAKGESKDGIVLFDNGLVYNPKEKNIYLYFRKENKYKIPKSLFIQENGILKEQVYPNNGFDFSVLVLQPNDGYKAILLDTALANSLLTRLYFLDGVSLKHFKPFLKEEDKGDFIYVYEIIWD